MSFLKRRKFILISMAVHGLWVLSLFLVLEHSATPVGERRQGLAEIDFKLLSAASSSLTNNKGGKISVAAPTAAPRARQPVSKVNGQTAPVGFVDAAKASLAQGASDGVLVSERERYLYELRTLIEQRKIYPQASKRLRETGRIVVSFQVMRDGRIDSVDMKSGSLYSRLNEAAIGLVRGIERFKPLPEALVQSHDQLSLEIPIEYVLN